jgi:hypothetical protein
VVADARVLPPGYPLFNHPAFTNLSTFPDPSRQSNTAVCQLLARWSTPTLPGKSRSKSVFDRSRGLTTFSHSPVGARSSNRSTSSRAISPRCHQSGRFPVSPASVVFCPPVPHLVIRPRAETKLNSSIDPFRLPPRRRTRLDTAGTGHLDPTRSLRQEKRKPSARPPPTTTSHHPELPATEPLRPNA